MKKIPINFYIIFLVFLLSITILSDEVYSTDNNCFYVGGTGNGNYSTIQNAIDIASSGDTVYVYPGIYYETINIKKTLNLVGENKLTTIIDGGNGYQTIIEISADFTEVSGFTIQNAKADGIGISGSDFNIIKNNIIKNTGSGIHISINITDYDTYESENSSNNNISENQIFDIKQQGIHLYKSHYNKIFSNTIDQCGVNGIFLSLSNNNRINGNSITESNQTGIMLASSSKNIILENTIETAPRGIYEYSADSIGQTSENNTISDNTFINIDEQFDYNSYDDIIGGDNTLVFEIFFYIAPIVIILLLLFVLWRQKTWESSRRTKIGNQLIIFGVLFAFLPTILTSFYLYFINMFQQLGIYGKYGSYLTLVLGIIVIIVGEYLRKNDK